MKFNPNVHVVKTSCRGEIVKVISTDFIQLLCKFSLYSTHFFITSSSSSSIFYFLFIFFSWPFFIFYFTVCCTIFNTNTLEKFTQNICLTCSIHYICVDLSFFYFIFTFLKKYCCRVFLQTKKKYSSLLLLFFSKKKMIY